MEIMEKEKILTECKDITKLMLEGYTTSAMAKKLNYSKSTISSRIKYLFNKYEVKTRTQYIVAIFGEILKEHKIRHEIYEKNIKRLKNEIKSLKEQLENSFKKVLKDEH